MRIAVASGKGGTGKTTVSLNLAKALGGPVQLLDCDVEEPNAHLFLEGRVLSRSEVAVPTPEVDASACDACGECGKICQYHAIVSLKTKPLVFPELCHGCGGCAAVCPTGAIREVDRRIGELEVLESGNITLIQGRLDVGVTMAPPLIRAVKSLLHDGSPAVLDAPPGTSCPMITTVRDADFVLLVTEPTPFGLNDLKLAIDAIAETGLPMGVVVNRADAGDDRVSVHCRERDIPILLEIPDDRRIAEAYSRGELILDALPEYGPAFEGLWNDLHQMKRNGREGHAHL